MWQVRGNTSLVQYRLLSVFMCKEFFSILLKFSVLVSDYLTNWLAGCMCWILCPAALPMSLWSTPEPSIKRVWPTVVPAQCRMTSLLCRSGRHLSRRGQWSRSQDWAANAAILSLLAYVNNRGTVTRLSERG